mmetsp:Transcript_66634/g.159267  ORF Transcript_66634/g.159267 Transcript_66634/m.159267 type:complete len:305 (+) Transcript_66634:466-1380(+)
MGPIFFSAFAAAEGTCQWLSSKSSASATMAESSAAGPILPKASAAASRALACSDASFLEQAADAAGPKRPNAATAAERTTGMSSSSSSATLSMCSAASLSSLARWATASAAVARTLQSELFINCMARLTGFSKRLTTVTAAALAALSSAAQSDSKLAPSSRSQATTSCDFAFEACAFRSLSSSACSIATAPVDSWNASDLGRRAYTTCIWLASTAASSACRFVAAFHFVAQPLGGRSPFLQAATAAISGFSACACCRSFSALAAAAIATKSSAIGGLGAGPIVVRRTAPAVFASASTVFFEGGN